MGRRSWVVSAESLSVFVSSLCGPVQRREGEEREREERKEGKTDLGRVSSLPLAPSSLPTPPTLPTHASHPPPVIKSLPLINRGRLSVQPVQSQAAFDLIVRMGETGGWPVGDSRPKPKKESAKKGKGKEEEVDGEKVGVGTKRKVEKVEEDGGVKEEDGEVEGGTSSGRGKSARKG